MKLKEIIVLIVIIIISVTCTSTKVHNNYRLGKKEFVLNKPTLIRTDGIYLTKISPPFLDYSWFKFIRFYEDGRCFYSHPFDSMPSTETLMKTDIKFGEQTFFRNERNSFKLETWANKYVGYMYEFGIADSSSISIIAYKYRGLSVKKNYEIVDQKIFKFIPLVSLDTSNW